MIDDKILRQDGNGVPHRAKEQLERGLSHLYAGRHERAVRSFRSVIRLVPDWTEGHLALGIAYAEMSQEVEMNDALCEMTRLRPGAGALHLSLGVVQGKMERHDAAIEHLVTATGLRPGDATAHYLLARAYCATAQYESALMTIKRTLRLVPNHYGASLLLKKCVLDASRRIETLTSGRARA